MTTSVVAALARRRCEVGFVLARWAIGTSVLREYLSLYAQRHYFWGEPLRASQRGDGDLGQWMSMSLFDIHPATWFFESVLVASITVSALFAIGVGGRLVTIATFIFLFSVHNANGLILDGGDNILRLVVFYWCFASNNPRGVLSRSCHNLALLAVVVQTCLLYFFAGFYKLSGAMWQSGVAVYYAMRTQWFTWPGVSDVVYGNEYIVVGATYATVVFELAFPFLLVNRYTKWIALAAGVAFHVGTAVFMGLVGFAWSMLSVYFLLLTDGEYTSIMATARGLKRRVARMTDKWPFSAPGRVPGSEVLLYDGDCGTCNRFVSFVFARDATIVATSIQGAIGRRILRRHRRDANRLESVYLVTGYRSTAERVLERSRAVAFTLAGLDSVYWRGVGWLVGLCPTRFADAVYGFVARHRHSVAVRGCAMAHKHRILGSESGGGVPAKGTRS